MDRLWFLPRAWSFAILTLSAGLLALTPLALTPLALAEDSPRLQFERQADEAYASFRSAYWYTRTGNPAVALFEMASFQEQWRTLQERFLDQPPPAYGDDPQWRDTLMDIAAAMDRGYTLAEAGDAKAANEAIAPIRDAFSQLRQRNRVRGFSDHVNAYGEVVDALSPFRNWDRQESAEDVLQLQDFAAVALYLLDQMMVQAPTRYADDPNFARAIDDNRRATRLFQKHLRAGNARGYKGSIRDIRSAYGLLFIKYG